MSKSLLRLVACLLVPCLALDRSLAMGLSYVPSKSSALTLAPILNGQALASVETMFAEPYEHEPACKVRQETHPATLAKTQREIMMVSGNGEKSQPPVTVTAIRQLLPNLIAESNLQPEQMTLQGLSEILYSRHPDLFGAAMTLEEKRALVALAFHDEWGHNDTIHEAIFSALEQRYRSPVFFERQSLLLNLEDEAESVLKDQKHALLPVERPTALAIKEFFGSAWNVRESLLLAGKRLSYPWAQAFFRLCQEPGQRLFIGQWERDYAEWLSTLSARQLQEEWERLGPLDRSPTDPFYQQTMRSYLLFVSGSSHPAGHDFRTSAETGADIHLQRDVRAEAVRILARMDIVLEWEARHWTPGFSRSAVHGVARRILPSSAYIRDSLLWSRNLDLDPEGEQLTTTEFEFVEGLKGISSEEVSSYLDLSQSARAFFLPAAAADPVLRVEKPAEGVTPVGMHSIGSVENARWWLKNAMENAKAVDVVGLLQEYLSYPDVAEEIQKRGIEVRTNFPESSSDRRVIASPHFLRDWGFESIIANAFLTMESGGVLDIQVERIGDELRIYIGDQGHGIHPDDLAHIWDLFASGWHKGVGGQGLPLAKETIHFHGGRIARKYCWEAPK